MSASTITLSIRTRWWFNSSVRLCMWVSRLTGWQPSEATIKRIVRYGVTIKP